jgi:cytochrome c2
MAAPTRAAWGLWRAPLLLILLGGAGRASPQTEPQASLYGRLVEELTGRAAAKETGCASCHAGIGDARLAAVRSPEGHRLRDPELERRLARRFPDSSERQRVVRAIMSHPRLDLYVAPGSPHPARETACLSCHGTQDRRADPSLTESQRRTWGEKYMRLHPGHDRTTLVPTPLLGASCARCHEVARPRPGADLHNAGLLFYERSGCYACHKSPGMMVRDEDLPRLPSGESDSRQKIRRPGPPLQSLSSKVDKEWTFNWILHPPAFKAGTKMPQFFRRGPVGWPSALVPDKHPRFLGGPLVRKFDAGEVYPEGYEVDEASEKALERVLAACLTEYLYSLSCALPLRETRKNLLPEGAARREQEARGHRLIYFKGCLGCHRLDEVYDREPHFEAVLKDYSHAVEEFAPSLAGSGEKFAGPAGTRWLLNWLEAPDRLFPETRMPNYGFTPEEAADVAAYLLSLRIDNRRRESRKQAIWKPEKPPLRVEGDEVGIEPDARKALEYLWSHANAPEMPETPREKVLRSGERAFEFFGCYGCHDLSDPARRGRDWPRLPLPDRPLDAHLIPPKGVMQRMPLYQSTRTEVDLAATYSLAAYEVARRGQEAPWDDRRWGEALVRRYNCAGCHVLEGPGLLVKDPVGGRPAWHEGVVKGESPASGERPHEYYVDWVLEASSLRLNPLQERYSDGLPVAEVLQRRAPSGGTLLHRLALRYQVDPRLVGETLPWLPPSLRDAGRKVNAEWLSDFLRSPVPIRPPARSTGPMPRFGLSEAEIQAIVTFLGAERREAERPAPEDWRDLDRMVRRNCLACHTLDGEGSPLAPDLAGSGRLTRAWLSAFLKSPLLLSPRIGMPQLAKELQEDPARFERLLDFLLHYPRVRLRKIVEGDLSMALEAVRGVTSEEETRAGAARGAREASPSLMEGLLSNRNAHLRRVAIRELAALRAAGTAAAVAPLLIDGDPTVRSTALEAIVRLGAADQVPAVAQLLVDPSENVRRETVDALVALQARSQIEPIASLLSDEASSVRLAALEALVELRARSAAGSIRRALGDEHPAVRGRAALALARLKGTEGAEGVLRLLHDPEPAVRWHAAVSLARMGREEAVGAFSSLMSAKLLDWLTPAVLREGATELNVLGERAAYEALRQTRLQGGERPVLDWIREAARLGHLEPEIDASAGPLLEGRSCAADGSAVELLAEITRRHRVFFVLDGGALKALPLSRAVGFWRP